MLPPHNALNLWTYPTFTPLDVRWIIWALTYQLRKRNSSKVKRGRGEAQAAVEEGLDAIALPYRAGDDGKELDQETEQPKPVEVGIGGLGVGAYHGRLRRGRRGSRSSAVGVMLDGYYGLLRKAVFLALILRLGVCSTAALWLWHRYRRYRTQREI